MKDTIKMACLSVALAGSIAAGSASALTSKPNESCTNYYPKCMDVCNGTVNTIDSNALAACVIDNDGTYTGTSTTCCGGILDDHEETCQYVQTQAAGTAGPDGGKSTPAEGCCATNSNSTSGSANFECVTEE